MPTLRAITTKREKPIILIANGSGIAPMRPIWQMKKDSPNALGDIIFFYGCRSRYDIYFCRTLGWCCKRDSFSILQKKLSLELAYFTRIVGCIRMRLLMKLINQIKHVHLPTYLLLFLHLPGPTTSSTRSPRTLWIAKSATPGKFCLPKFTFKI